MPSSTNTTTTNPTELGDALREIGLRSLEDCLEDIVARATRARWSVIEILAEIVRAERQERARRSVERHLGRDQSRVPRRGFMSGDDVHKVRAFEHPGAGRKRAKATPKGRQVDPAAAHEIEVLLADRPRRRDLLIEYLHLIQDKYHEISAAHLAALADEMRLSFAEVFETATFYAHFDIVKEGEPDIAPLTVRVCDSLTCAMLGGEKLLKDLQSRAGPGIRVVRAPCVGRCDTAPTAEVGHNFVDAFSF